MGIEMRWNDASRNLTMQLAEGSKMLPTTRRNIQVKLGETRRDVVFAGEKLEIHL
jgi:hypothetical protein